MVLLSVSVSFGELTDLNGAIVYFDKHKNFDSDAAKIFNNLTNTERIVAMFQGVDAEAALTKYSAERKSWIKGASYIENETLRGIIYSAKDYKKACNSFVNYIDMMKTKKFDHEKAMFVVITGAQKVSGFGQNIGFFHTAATEMASSKNEAIKKMGNQILDNFVQNISIFSNVDAERFVAEIQQISTKKINASEFVKNYGNSFELKYLASQNDCAIMSARGLICGSYRDAILRAASGFVNYKTTISGIENFIKAINAADAIGLGDSIKKNVSHGDSLFKGINVETVKAALCGISFSAVTEKEADAFKQTIDKLDFGSLKSMLSGAKLVGQKYSNLVRPINPVPQG
jgi:uncharacterized protein YhaN